MDSSFFSAVAFVHLCLEVMMEILNKALIACELPLSLSSVMDPDSKIGHIWDCS